jgi:rRNA maturation protein Rpf1
MMVHASLWQAIESMCPWMERVRHRMNTEQTDPRPGLKQALSCARMDQARSKSRDRHRRASERMRVANAGPHVTIHGRPKGI